MHVHPFTFTLPWFPSLSAAGESGLKRSLFERYADMYTKAREKQKKRGEETGQDKHAYTQLQEQYRMVGKQKCGGLLAPIPTAK